MFVFFGIYVLERSLIAFKQSLVDTVQTVDDVPETIG